MQENLLSVIFSSSWKQCSKVYLNTTQNLMQWIKRNIRKIKEPYSAVELKEFYFIDT